MTTAERFWSRVEKRDGGCWIWVGAVWPHGYGAFTYNNGRRTTVRAHRFAWELANGPIPAGLVVMHKCDVPACVNPAHLQIGTQAENRRDCVVKGRQAKGATNGAAKLDAEKVREIRRSPLTLETLARRYGVNMTAIHKARTGETWKSVTDEKEQAS